MKTDTANKSFLRSLPDIEKDRLKTTIETFAKLSETGQGVTRLAYTGLEREAHAVFAGHMTRLGLRVWTDAAGNTLAEKDGNSPGLPAIGIGSHLDSVPTGGRFDGIAGVAAAMEVARVFVERDIKHAHPLRFVAFAAEEGARFGQACTGSRIVSGATNAADLEGLVDSEGISVAEAMRLIDMDPTRVEEARWEPSDWAGFIELHIEQGGALADAGIPVGVVDLISGSTRIQFSVGGRASHTGGTPMHLRVDALAAASEIVLAAEELALDERHRGTRITVGKLDVLPGSITTIPGECHLYVDIRDVDADRQRTTGSGLIERAYAIAARRGASIETTILGDADPVVLPTSVRDAIVRSVQDIGVPYRVMPSGASHDTQMINHVCPSGMIFIPSLNHGVSHSPDELTTYEDLAIGTSALAASLLTLDSDLVT